MKRIEFPKPISHVTYVDNQTHKPVVVKFADWMMHLVLADPAWQEGNNNEASTKLETCDRLQELLDAEPEPDHLDVTDADQEALSAIARLRNRLPAPLHPKEKRFMLAITSAKSVKESKSELGAAI